MNQPVHIPRALWERLIARFRTSSIAVSKDHGCSKVQQWRRTTDVDFRQPTEKKKKERNVEAGSILLFLQREEKIRHSVDRSREENVLGEDGSAEELEEAGSPFA